MHVVHCADLLAHNATLTQRELKSRHFGLIRDRRTHDPSDGRNPTFIGLLIAIKDRQDTTSNALS
jgi:hypothetical protein